MTFSGTDVTSSRTAALLERAETNLRRDRETGAERLVVAREWALCHGTRFFETPVDSKPLGAIGVEVYEYAPAELAIALELHPQAAKRLMADAVDLHDRLPSVWATVQSLELEAWVARKIVHLTRELDDEAVAHVDAAIADVLTSLPTGRLLTLVEARVIEADTALADAKAAEAERRRFVTVGRDNEHGVRGFVARMDATAASRLFATVDQMADLMDDDETSLDELRAHALGLLADPAGAAAFLEGRDPGRGKAVVYVHTTSDFWQHGTGVARIETLHGSFAATRALIARLLGHDRISLKPVIDLADQVSADRYEIPADISERLHLIKPADVFPFAESTSRAMDQDHTIPWPRGSTSVDNLGPMTRSHHRIKTHAHGWDVTQLPDHRYLWRTPHGRYLIVDHAGTHAVRPPSSSRFEVAFSRVVASYEAAA